MNRTLLALFSLGAAAVAQDPAAECAEALLRSDHAGAARAAAMPASAAARARLQAALLPVEPRPAAMLAVAQAFPADPEADAALLAGAAATLVVLQRSEVVPGLAAWTELAGEASRYAADTSALARVVLGLRDAVVARTRLGGDPARLREAQRLLDLACVSRFGLWPARVARDAVWERPTGLAADLQLRALPRGPGYVGWDEIDALPAPAWQAVLPRAGDLKLPPLPPGHWLLEARSAAAPWRGVRAIEVSDLDAVALAAGGAMVLAAFDRAGPTAAQWQLRAGTAELAHGELGPAPVVVPWPPAKDREGSARDLVVRGTADSAWLEVREGERFDIVRAKWVAHGMVDRPLYRPGETVQGRIVLRSCGWQGDGLAAVPTTRVAADQPLRVVGDLGSVGKVELPVRTDAHGVCAFSFAVPAEVPPGTWFPFAIELPEVGADGKPLRVHMGELCGATFFRRPAVRLRVTGPEQVPAGTAIAEIAASVEWASGGPAVGLEVCAHVTAWRTREREEQLILCTGDDGRAVVRVPVATLDASWVRVAFEVTGPDGQVTRETHQIRVVAPGRDTESANERSPADAPDLDLAPAVVGAPCRVTLRGAAQQRAVLVVGRGTNARAQAVQLDTAGRAQIDLPVLRLDWPLLDVTVATRESEQTMTVPVALRTTRAPTIDLPAPVVPGSEVAIRVGTDAPGTVVTVAVVDERIFELQPDCTPEPNDALRPGLPYWRWDHAWAPPRQSPAELLGSLLGDGRLPPIDDSMRDLSRSWTGAGGGIGSRSRPGGLRADFRPTAAFVTAVTGDDGTATVHFTMPSDLTRWRVTAVGIDPEGTSFVATRTLASRQPLAAEPLLPRGIRAGDAFALPIAIDRSADANAPDDKSVVEASVDGGALALAAASREVTVRAGHVARTTLDVRAAAPGTAKLSLGIALGEHVDRSQRDVVVGRDAVVRPLHAAALGTGEIAVALPDGASADDGLTVDVLLGGAAAWRQLEQDLAAYPHGCVEQTLSRLVPYFAAARAAKARGEPLPAMDVEFRKRLHQGLARLRELQHYHGGFAFWPGGEPDPGMTALALHGLATLRDGGYDPAQAGLSVDAHDRTFYAVDRLFAHDLVLDAQLVPAAELAVALARYGLDAERAREACERLLDVLPQLPAGLCARLGLARCAGGDAAGARRCWERLAAAKAPALTAAGFPGEDPLAVQALQLELATALHVDAARIDQAAADLLLACLQGQGSTYGHACALAALAQVLPRTPDVTASIEVRAGGEARTFALGGQAGDVVHWRLSHATPVTVRGPAGVALLVRLAGERSERASDHKAWRSPIQVERELCTLRTDVGWRRQYDDTDLLPLQGPVVVGRPLVLRVRVQSLVPMRYLVVECPLPAGFELGAESEGVDRYDDRIVFSCDLPVGEPCVRTIRIVPTIAGRLLWPPAVAAPMYVAGQDGGCAGGFLDVSDVAAGDLPAAVTCLTTPAPPPPPETKDPLGDYVEALRDAWSREPVDEVVSRREVAALLATVPEVSDADRWRWLGHLTHLVGNLDPPHIARDRPEISWRMGALDRLRALQRDATSAALALTPANAPMAAADEVRALAAAVGAWPADALREAALAQLLARARATAPQCIGRLLDEVPDPAKDAALCFELRACLTSADTAVRRAAFAALPPEQRAKLPPVLVLGAQGAELQEGVVRMLAASDAGRAELQVRLRDPDFVLPQRDRLAAELPEDLWREIPLDVLRSLTAAVAEARDDAPIGPPRISALVAAGPFATADLLQAMAATQEPAWRSVLAKALRQRGATSAMAAVRADDGLWPLWSRALALAKDDAAGAQALLDELDGKRTAKRLDREADLLAAFAVPALVVAGTPQQLYAARQTVPDADWPAAWARLDGTARIALVDRFQKWISGAFVPATAAEAEAIWRFVERGDSAANAVEALTQSFAGLECARRHLDAGDGGANGPAFRGAFAKVLGLDADTLAPEPGGEWRALLERVRRFGHAGEWTHDELDQLARLRSLRGFAPAGR